MHQAVNLRSSDGAEIKPARAKLSKKGRLTRAGGRRLLDREALDGRLAVTKVYDQLVGQIHHDLGGPAELSAIEHELSEAFAGASIVLKHLNTQIVTGSEINPSMVAMHTAAISAMVRCASKLGTSRRARPVEDLDTFLAQRAKTKRLTAEPPTPCEGEPE
jgi:hypothetical protein